MKKILTVMLTLTLFQVTSYEINAGSPQKCRETLINVGNELGFDEPFWELSKQKIREFKKDAKQAGLWKKFAKICNAWPADECNDCKCSKHDFKIKGCALNCACCWGNEPCSSEPIEKMLEEFETF